MLQVDSRAVHGRQASSSPSQLCLGAVCIRLGRMHFGAQALQQPLLKEEWALAFWTIYTAWLIM